MKCACDTAILPHLSPTLYAHDQRNPPTGAKLHLSVTRALKFATVVHQCGSPPEIHFTATGGTWSDWFFHYILVPHTEAHLVAHHVYQDEKSTHQFKVWVTQNKISHVCHTTLESIPLAVIRADYDGFYNNANGNPQYPTVAKLIGRAACDSIIREYHMHVRSAMIVPNGIGTDMREAYGRNNRRFLTYLIADMTDRAWLNNAIGPGPGFEFLDTGFQTTALDQIGEHQTRTYIHGASRGMWLNTLPGPIHVTPNHAQLGLALPRTLYFVGRAPPRTNQPISAVRTSDITPYEFDAQAVAFFEELGFNDNYHAAPCCLANELVSLFKFCPDVGDSGLASNLTSDDLFAVEFAFERCCYDWDLEPRALPLMSYDEVVAHRSWNTSPGYPYNKNGATDCRMAYDVFRAHISDFVTQSTKTWFPTLYNVFGKKEILPSTKGDDIRTVIAPCLAHQLMAQRLTLNISEHVGRNFRRSHTQIGRTRYHGDVDRTAKRIGRFDYIVEYDMQKWDRTIQALPMKLFAYYCWLVIDTDDHADFFQLMNMFESTIYSFCASRNGDIYRKRYGVPSGFTLTSYANSWIHTFFQYYMYYKLFPAQDKRTYSRDVWDHNIAGHFDFVCYGDDGLMGLSSECAQWFSNEARAAILRDTFNVAMPPEKCKIARAFSLTHDGNDVTGIRFLGDVMHATDDRVVPVFSLSKVVGSIIHGALGRKYTPLERFVIAYTHAVELRYHPRRLHVYNWLKELAHPTLIEATTRYTNDVVKQLSSTIPELVKLVMDILDEDMFHQKLDNFIELSYYLDPDASVNTLPSGAPLEPQPLEQRPHHSRLGSNPAPQLVLPSPHHLPS